MPFNLSRVESGVWSGSAGKTFEVDVTPAPGGGPFLIHSVCYGDTCLNAAPFRFVIAAGNKGLSAVYDWDQEGEWVALRELADGDSQNLRRRRYKEQEPFQSVLIQGS